MLISLAGVFFASDILALMGASKVLIDEGVEYTRLMLIGNFNIMLLFLINGIFRGAGDASLAMRSLWLANILNICLDPLFIFGLGPVPAFGMEGAAIATNIGRTVGVVYQCYFLWKGSSIIRIHKENLIIKWKTIWQLIRISLGGMGQFLIGSASWIFLVRIISIFGSDALAGYTIAIREVIFTILPSWGLSNAAATLVGQNLGAGQPERAEQSVWKAALYNMIFLTSVSIVFFLMAESIIRLFTQEVQVVYYGRLCLQYVCLGYIFYAYGMVISQSFNGAGDTKTPTIINLICFWMMQIPLAYILSVWLKLGPQGAFMAIAISDSCLALISIAIFRKGKWKLVKV